MRASLIALVLIFVWAPAGIDAEPAPNPPVLAARALVASLQPNQRARLMLPFNDAARRDWHFTPRRRKGLALKDMNAAQRRQAHDLLASALSAEGHEKVRNVFRIEKILQDNLSKARRRVNPDWRNPLLYHQRLRRPCACSEGAIREATHPVCAPPSRRASSVVGDGACASRCSDTTALR